MQVRNGSAWVTMGAVEQFTKESFQWEDSSFTLFRRGTGPGVIFFTNSRVDPRDS